VHRLELGGPWGLSWSRGPPLVAHVLGERAIDQVPAGGGERDHPAVAVGRARATSPVVMMLFAWAVLRERLRAAHLTGAALGIAGVGLMLLRGATAADPRGVLASVLAMAMPSLGYILAKRWSAGVDVTSLTSWLLIAGGAVLLPVAAAVGGRRRPWTARRRPPSPTSRSSRPHSPSPPGSPGLRHLSEGTVGLIGLVNPIAGVALGTAIAGRR
jgi:probable blue pigment (indigoidine) exporter